MALAQFIVGPYLLKNSNYDDDNDDDDEEEADVILVIPTMTQVRLTFHLQQRLNYGLSGKI